MIESKVFKHIIIKNILQISNLFTQKQINHFFLKGIFLSKYLYNDYKTRNSKDIDIYIHPTGVFKAINELKNIGFESFISDELIKKIYIPFRQNILMYKDILGITVCLDIHLYIYDYFGNDINVYLKNTTLIYLKNKGIRTLNREYSYYLFLDHTLKDKRLDQQKKMDIRKFLNINKEFDDKYLKKILIKIYMDKYKDLNKYELFLKQLFSKKVKGILFYFIRHFFIPFYVDEKKYGFSGKCIYLYFLVKPWDIVKNLCKR